MDLFLNIDLLTVGLAAVIGIVLGFAIFIREPRNSTHILFFLFAVINAIWAIANYITYQISNDEFVLLFIRLIIFLAIWQTLLFFLLINSLPQKKLKIEKSLSIFLIMMTILVSIMAFSPLIFPRVIISNENVPQPIPAPGIIIFGITAISLVVGGLIDLINKIKIAVGKEKAQFQLIFAGVVIMFGSIIAFNFILPALFLNSRFIPLSGIFTLPFIILTGYAITKRGFLDIRIITTEILIVFLLLSLLLEMVLSKNIIEIAFKACIFLLVLIFSMLLMKSIFKEVEQKIKLEELDKLKSQFLSFASHQLRGPLGIIKTLSMLIVKEQYGIPTPAIKENVIKIRNSAAQLIDLTDNFLNLRKIEEGKLIYQFKNIDIISLVKEVAEKYKPLTKEKNLFLTLDLPEIKLDIRGDSNQLEQVFQNLIDNAIKYTGSGGINIKIETLKNKKSVLIAIADSGLGMEAPLIPNLFEEFNRAQEVKNIKGTGLGLYIAKKIISDHGGKIWAESDGPSKGSTFFVELPKD